MQKHFYMVGMTTFQHYSKLLSEQHRNDGSNDYQDMYLLQVVQSSSLSFSYYDLTNETMVYEPDILQSKRQQEGILLQDLYGH